MNKKENEKELELWNELEFQNEIFQDALQKENNITAIERILEKMLVITSELKQIN